MVELMAQIENKTKCGYRQNRKYSYTSYIPPWGVVLHIGVTNVPREGYNYYTTCHLGNTTVEDRYLDATGEPH